MSGSKCFSRNLKVIAPSAPDHPNLAPPARACRLHLRSPVTSRGRTPTYPKQPLQTLRSSFYSLWLLGLAQGPATVEQTMPRHRFSPEGGGKRSMRKQGREVVLRAGPGVFAVRPLSVYRQVLGRLVRHELFPGG